MVFFFPIKTESELTEVCEEVTENIKKSDVDEEDKW